MGRARKSMGELGTLGVLRETLNLFRGYAGTLLSIYLTLLLPCAIVNMAFQQYCNHSPTLMRLMDTYIPSLSFSELQPVAIADLISKDVWLVLEVAVVVEAGSGFGVDCTPVLAMALMYLLVTVLTSVVWIVPLVSTVVCIYTRDRLAFVQMLAELSLMWRPWKRVLFTGLWGFLAILATLSLNCALAKAQMFIFNTRSLWLPSAWSDNLMVVFIVLSAITTSVSLAAVLYIVTVLQVAYGVSALELPDDETGDYRWDALAKGAKLLNGKRAVAVSIFLVYTVLGCLLRRPRLNAVGPSAVPDDPEEDAWRPVVLGASAVVLSAFVTLASSLSMGVLYVSCKAFHFESILVEHASLLMTDRVVDDEYLSTTREAPLIGRPT